MQQVTIDKLPNNQYSASITNHNASASHYGFETLEEAEAWVEVMKPKVQASTISPDNPFEKLKYVGRRASYFVGDN